MMKKRILMIAAFVLTLASGAIAQEKQGYKIGDKARDFKLKNVDGKMVSLADDKEAKGFIVIFTCNHCPFAIATEDRIMALDKQYRKKGYPVIAINPNDPKIQPEDSYKEMQKRAEEKSYTFPYLVDATQEIAKTYGATRTPHVFLLKKEGTDYVVKYIGSIDDNTREPDAVTEKFVEKAISALEANKEPNPSETKAVGCTIKWKE
jgi:peroxiredoxin